MKHYTKKLSSPAQTILSGDGPDDAPTWSSRSRLPFDATTNADSFAQRHLEGANYGFADGHVKWLKPQTIKPTLSQTQFAPTFAIR